MRAASAGFWVKIIDTVFAVALFLYPLAVYAGLSAWGPRVLVPLLLIMFGARILRARPTSRRVFSVTLIIAIVGILLVLASWMLGKFDLLLWYPVSVSFVLLLGFGWSLFFPPTIVERIARLTDPNLPPEAIAYTRNVTRIWCVFFIINGLIAAATCLHGDLRIWTLYNGAISYALMGTLMLGEWLVRRRFLGKNKTE